MNYDLRDSDLSTVLAEADLVGDETKRLFGRLSGEQMNWKPRPGEWSIGQCFDHLIISNRPYVPIFEDILAGRRRPRVWERMPLLPRLFGTLLIGLLRPDSDRRARARPAFYPSSSHIPPAIIATFLEQQEQLLRLMGASRDLDLDRIVTTSPVLGPVTYSLMDACRIIVVHEQNHVVQAARVTESPASRDDQMRGHGSPTSTPSPTSGGRPIEHAARWSLAVASISVPVSRAGRETRPSHGEVKHDDRRRQWDSVVLRDHRAGTTSPRARPRVVGVARELGLGRPRLGEVLPRCHVRPTRSQRQRTAGRPGQRA
jgi:hypothetical protein